MPISELQLQCQTKNKLLHLDLLLLQAFTQGLDSAFRIMPLFYSTAAIISLLDAEQFLATFNPQYAAPLEQLERDDSFTSLNKVDQLLETVLGMTYHHRVQLDEALRELIETSITALDESSVFLPKASAIENSLFALSREINILIKQVNFTGGIALFAEAAFAKNLHLFTESFTTFWQELEKSFTLPEPTNSALVPNEKPLPNHRYLTKTIVAIKQLTTRLFIGNHFLLLETPVENLLHFLSSIIKPPFLLPLLKLSQESLEDYENYFAQREEKKLQNFLGIHYSVALKKIKQIILLKEWLAQLTCFYNRSLARHETSGRWYALEVKKLLTRTKTAHYVAFHQNKSLQARWIVTLAQIVEAMHHQSPALKPQQVLERLTLEREETKTAVTRKELALQDYSWTDGFSSSLLRLGTENIYYQWAEALLAGITQSNPIFAENHPALQPTLTTGLAAVFCGIEARNYQWLGVSYSMLASVSHFLSDDINSLLRIADSCGIEDSTVASQINKIQWLCGLGISLGAYFLFLGLNLETCGYATIGYIIATTCQSLLDRLATHYLPNAGATEFEEKGIPEVTLFAKYTAQYTGFLLGNSLWRESYPSVYSFFHPPVHEQLSDSNLLMNTQFCHTFAEECSKVALKHLGLKKGVTLEDIRRQRRKLASKLHPDISDGHTDEFNLVTLAEVRLVELAEKKSEHTFSS